MRKQEVGNELGVVHKAKQLHGNYLGGAVEILVFLRRNFASKTLFLGGRRVNTMTQKDRRDALLSGD